MSIKFCQLPLGAKFEFKGRRYEKLALSLARDEERFGNVFHAETEVSAERRGEEGRSTEKTDA
jgi:hypothetical protein